MARRTVFVIHSESPNWAGVRATLTSMADVSVVGETASAADARARVPAARPDVIISPAQLGGGSAIPLLASLQAQLPGVISVVFAGRRAVDELIKLAGLQNTGYFVWADLDDPAFPGALHAAVSGSFAVGSREAHMAFINAVRGPTAAPAPSDLLTDQRWRILMLLADGQTRGSIARLARKRRPADTVAPLL